MRGHHVYSPDSAGQTSSSLDSAPASAVVTIKTDGKSAGQSKHPASAPPADSSTSQAKRPRWVVIVFALAMLTLAVGIGVGVVWVVQVGQKHGSQAPASSGAAPLASCVGGCGSAAQPADAPPPPGNVTGDPLPPSSGDNLTDGSGSAASDARQGPTTPIDVSLFDHPYDRALGASFEFYEAQRSGRLPGDNRVSWRADSALDDGSDDSLNLEGGWYYAGGSRLKATFPTAYAVAQLAWGCSYYRSTYGAVQYQGKSALHWCQREVKWGALWLRKCQLESSVVGVAGLVVLVGDPAEDSAYYGRAENMTMRRPVLVADGPTQPATEVGCQYAAALAATAYLFKDDDPGFAADCLASAKEVYTWATTHVGLYSDSSPEYAALYTASNYEMHWFYAAAMLHFATTCNEPGGGALCDQQSASLYYADALNLWSNPVVSAGCAAPASNWDNLCYDASLLLVQASGQTDSVFTEGLARFVSAVVAADASAGWMATPKGLRMQMPAAAAPLRDAAASAHVALMFSDLPGLDGSLALRARCYARSQLGYILGDTQFSFVVGLGDRYPLQPHHKDASCTLDESQLNPNYCSEGGAWSSPRADPNIVTGALVAGPDANDFYSDARADIASSEVSIEYNSAYTTALAGLVGVPQAFWQDLGACAPLVAYPWPSPAAK